MSSFGRKSSSARVFLNVYDLNEQSNEYLYPLGLGVYHSGVEISGVEYTFASESGIFEMTPKHAPPAKFRESIDLGPAPTSRDISSAIEDLKHDFKGTDYHVLNKNCNHFAGTFTSYLPKIPQFYLIDEVISYAEMFVKRLLNRSIPGYVNRLAGMGSMVSCLIPQALTGNAPVGDGSSTGHPGDSSSSSSRTAAPFAGAGFKLGNPAMTSSVVSLLSTAIFFIFSQLMH